jgi:hypothetical protein
VPRRALALHPDDALKLGQSGYQLVFLPTRAGLQPAAVTPGMAGQLRDRVCRLLRVTDVISAVHVPVVQNVADD